MTVHPFTPRREDPSRLDARTVGPAEVLNAVVTALRTAATTSSRPHSLVIGPAGSGKTHLVEVALHRGAAPGLAVVRLPEDATDVIREQDIQRHVLATLAPETPLPAVGDRVEAITAALGQRTLVLVIENTDRVFADLGLEGQRRLRSWVETQRNVLLLATSPRLFDAVSKRDHPWFGGFATYLLPDWAAADAQNLLETRARQRGDAQFAAFVRSSQGEQAIADIAALTAGSPRVWTILAQTDPGCLLDVSCALEVLMEALVPYYQHVLWQLSPTERLLVTHLALAGPLTVTRLAEACEVDPGTTANTLRRLTRAAIVTAEKPRTGDRRQTYYDVCDPLLALHLGHRQGYSTRNPTSGR